MIKKIVAAVLIVLAGGAWFYLNQLAEQEQQATEQMRKEMEQARAQAKAKEEARIKFETQLQTDLTACLAAAEQAKNDFITQNQVPVKRKPGQFTIPPAVAEEAAKTQEAANAACQTTYDTKLKSGS